MGRQRSVGEVGLPQVVPQSALSVKNPPVQTKAQIQAKQRPSRTPRNRWKKPTVENVDFPSVNEPWGKEDWEKIRKYVAKQKENRFVHHHDGGDLEAQSTEPSKVQPQRRRWPRSRKGPKRSNYKWGKRKAAVEDEDLPLPPVCELKRVDNEDWDQELREQGGGDHDDNHGNPFSIEDVLTVALMKLSIGEGKNGRISTLYNPSIHHMPPVKWDYGFGVTVDGQFSDADE